jgi:hypothetical protein
MRAAAGVEIITAAGFRLQSKQKCDVRSGKGIVKRQGDGRDDSDEADQAVLYQASDCGGADDARVRGGFGVGGSGGWRARPAGLRLR